MLAGLGIILLLLNIGVISLEIKAFFVMFYPFILLGYGLLTLTNSILKKGQSFLWPFFIIVFSMLLVLDRLNIFTFYFTDAWKLWPLIMIYLGFYMMFRKNKIKVHMKTDFPVETLDLTEEDIESDALSHSSSLKRIKGISMGDVNFKKQNWAVEPIDLYNMAGDYFIDFSKGFIPEKETPIKVRGWIGDVKMLIPEGIPVIIRAAVNVGDVRVFDCSPNQVRHAVQYKSDNYDKSTRKLNISIDLKIGSIRIDKV